MLTSQDIKETYYERLGVGNMAKSKGENAQESEPLLFSLNVRVTESQVSVSSSFPGGQFSASGDTNTLIDFIEGVWPQVQQGIKKCASKVKEQD